VTTAPDYSDENLASFLTLHPDIHTRTEELSDTVMNASALNEFLDSASGMIMMLKLHLLRVSDGFQI